MLSEFIVFGIVFEDNTDEISVACMIALYINKKTELMHSKMPRAPAKLYQNISNFRDACDDLTVLACNLAFSSPRLNAERLSR